MLQNRTSSSRGRSRTTPSELIRSGLGTGKRGHYERGLFTGGISGISRISKFSRISRKWSDSPLFSTMWGGSLETLESLESSRISRKWTFLKRPLFQKTPFSRTRGANPENRRRSKGDAKKGTAKILS